MTPKTLLISFIAFLTSMSMLLAGTPKILDAKATRSGMGWRIDVTLSHSDTGWDHYADAWEIVDKNGRRLAIRHLAHPHVKEQPFTRSLTGIMLPDGTRRIYIRAKCSKGDFRNISHPVDLKY